MSEQITLIRSGRSEKEYWKDLWRNKELLWILAKRDIAVRYKQTLLGIAWSVVRPLLTMIIMVFVFSKVAKLSGDPGVPYPLMVLAGITVWTFFSSTFTQISNSIVLNSNLVSKVYFPRLLMPISSVSVGFVDFVISLCLFIGFGLYYSYPPGWQIIFLPIFIFLALSCALAFGLLFAAINVRFRDIGQLIPFLVQVGFYVCPVAYSTRLIKDDWYYKYYILNPMVGIIDGFKWCLLGDNVYLNLDSLYSSVIVTAVMLIFSTYFFRKRENTFVDYI